MSRFPKFASPQPGSRFANLMTRITAQDDDENLATSPQPRAVARTPLVQPVSADAAKLRSSAPASSAPKPSAVPIPADVSAQGVHCARAYASGFREHNQRFAALASNAVGKSIALAGMLGEGLGDDEIVARLPSAESDEDRRIRASWSRAVASVNRQNGFGDDDASATKTQRCSGLWARIVAKVNDENGFGAHSTDGPGEKTARAGWQRAVAKINSDNSLLSDAG